MGALRDILGYFTRRKFLKKADPEDVLIIGVHNEPDMTGVPGPVPVKDAKLIRVKDLNLEATPCENKNVGDGAGVFAKQTTDPCTNEFRTLKSISLNLGITQVDDSIQFDTAGEPNTAENLGEGVGVYKDKVGESLRFKSLKTDGTIGITENKEKTEIIFSGGGGGCPVTYVLKPTSCNTEGPEPICTVSEIPNTWLFSCRSDLGAMVGGYVSLQNNGVGVTYPAGEEFVRNCWYVEVWDPIPTKLDDCTECCTLIPIPPDDPIDETPKDE
jgi:hypothetical protein